MFRDIFSTYTYTGMCNVDLKNFKKHILDTRKKIKKVEKLVMKEVGKVNYFTNQINTTKLYSKL